MSGLGDVATYINGYAFKPSDYSDTGLPIIRIQDLTGNAYQTNRYEGILSERYAVDDGDILISWSASLGVFEWDGGPAWLNQHIFKVSFDKMQVDKRFFVHQARFLMEASANLAHGATMRHLTKKVFDSLPFYFPRSERQRAIADQLDGIDMQLCNATNQLYQLDSLVKSRFVEMFGDLESNDVGWGFCPLSQLADVRDGTHDSPKYQDEGIPLLTSKNFTGGGVSFKGAKLISKEDFLAISRRSKVDYGDIIMPMIGTIGCPVIVETNEDFAIKNVALIKLKDSGLNAIFLKHILLSSYFEHEVERSNRGATQRFFSLANLRNLPIPIVEPTYQYKFATFVQRVDKLRFAIQEQIEKLETLKASLMQEYFG